MNNTCLRCQHSWFSRSTAVPKQCPNCKTYKWQTEKGTKKWSFTRNIETAKNLGIIEFEDNKGEFHDFYILQTATHLAFGGACNTGFLESGNMKIDTYFSIDENLQELLADLEVYYNDGPRYCSRIRCNERM